MNICVRVYRSIVRYPIRSIAYFLTTLLLFSYALIVILLRVSIGSYDEALKESYPSVVEVRNIIAKPYTAVLNDLLIFNLQTGVRYSDLSLTTSISIVDFQQNYRLKGINSGEGIDHELERIQITQGFWDNERSNNIMLSEATANLFKIEVGDILSLSPDLTNLLHINHPISGNVVAIYRNTFNPDNDVIYASNTLIEAIDIQKQKVSDFEQSSFYPSSNIIKEALIVDAYGAWIIEQVNEDHPYERRMTVNDQISVVAYSINDLTDIIEAIHERYPDDNTDVSASNDLYSKVMIGITSIQRSLTQHLFISVTIAVIILTFLLIILIREKRRDIGIYLAIGMSRMKIIVSLILQYFFLTVAAAITSAILSTQIAEPLFSRIIRQSAFELSAVMTNHSIHALILDTRTCLFLSVIVLVVTLIPVPILLYWVNMKPRKLLNL